MSSINQVLQMDDAVDELSESEVKDVWVRGNFMHQIIRANGPEFMRTDECDHLEQILKETDNAGLMQASIIGLGREHSVTQSLGWENGPGNVETLRERLTANDVSVDELRENLKSTLRGSGMPRISVMRSRVRYYVE